MTLGVIPARGGSKRIPRKNIREFCGKPLIAWTIEAAKASHLDDFIVSTDDIEIWDVAAKYGAKVVLRPSGLATDDARSVDVVIHALCAYALVHKMPDAVALLQPTSPTRTAADIDEYLGMFELRDRNSLITAKQDGSPSGTFYVAKTDLVMMWEKLYDDNRTNVLELRYTDIDTEEDWKEAERIMCLRSK